MILLNRERWQRLSSEQKQPMLIGVLLAMAARSATLWRPVVVDNNSRS